MRDWKVFRPHPSSAATGQELDAPPVEDGDDRDEPQFEIALDMNADQLTLMFDDVAPEEPVKYEQRSTYTPSNEVDHQEAWRRQALREKVNIADNFGDWSEESSLDGSTYYRKVTRLR